MQLQRIAITPHSLAPSAIKATIATFKALPGCVFEPDDDPIDKQGRITGSTSNAHMVGWMSDRQGYAKKVERIYD